MVEPRDYGIAVADATRLNDCYHELSEAFAARPAIDGDAAHWWRNTYSNESREGREYVHRHNSANVAEMYIRRGILDRSIPLWIRLANRDEQTDANAIAVVERRTVAAGAYVTHNYPKSNLEGRPLWIKNADWSRFRERVMIERYSNKERSISGRVSCGHAFASLTEKLGDWEAAASTLALHAGASNLGAMAASLTFIRELYENETRWNEPIPVEFWNVPDHWPVSAWQLGQFEQYMDRYETIQALGVTFDAASCDDLVRSFHATVAKASDALPAADDPLALWLALERRRASAAFDKSRKVQDADCEAKGLRKSGVRVKLTLNSASEICVALADATIAKAAEFQSSPAAFADARSEVEAFTKEVTRSAVGLAFFVSGETGVGGSVVQAATERGQQLCADVEGAFILATQPHPVLATRTATLDSLFAHWREEATLDYQAASDTVSSEFSLAGRTQSAYHIRRLSEAAERCARAMLSKARALPIKPLNYGTARENALALLAELALDVRAVAIGASGRMPTPANGAVADQFIEEGRTRIEAEVDKWKLEDQLRLPVPSPPADNSHHQAAGLAPVIKRRGRKVGSGSMANADRPLFAEMNQLILDGKAFSPNGAATQLAEKASGSATIDSKITRLAKGYRASDFYSVG